MGRTRVDKIKPTVGTIALKNGFENLATAKNKTITMYRPIAK